MVETGLIEKFDQYFILENGLTEEVNRTNQAIKRAATRNKLAQLTREVGKSGDLNLIVAVERQFLENDQAQYSNSPAMKSSLKGALDELDAAERTIPLTADPNLYQAVNDSHGHPKSRVGKLPKDAARRFFASQAARLLNQDKSRLDAEEKTVLDARKRNMRTAGDLYANLQRQALGIKPVVKDRGKGMEMER